MNKDDEILFLIKDEIDYFNEISRQYPYRILQDFDVDNLDGLIKENTEELHSIAIEIQQELSYIPNMEVYNEAQQMLLGISYSPQLMNLFLQKKSFIEKLIKIRDNKIKETEHKDKGKIYLLESQMKEVILSKNILDVIEKYAGLPARNTKNRNIPCPLPGHEDKTGSFHIYDKTNSFYCYGCRRGGGIVQFIKHFKGISDKEAFKELFPQR